MKIKLEVDQGYPCALYIHTVMYMYRCTYVYLTSITIVKMVLTEARDTIYVAADGQKTFLELCWRHVCSWAYKYCFLSGKLAIGDTWHHGRSRLVQSVAVGVTWGVECSSQGAVGVAHSLRGDVRVECSWRDAIGIPYSSRSVNYTWLMLWCSV